MIDILTTEIKHWTLSWANYSHLENNKKHDKNITVSDITSAGDKRTCMVRKGDRSVCIPFFRSPSASQKHTSAWSPSAPLV